MTINTDVSYTHNWNGYILKRCMSNNWRASLVPAAAVIPAPIAYTKVVVVKTLVVNTRVGYMPFRARSRLEIAKAASALDLCPAGVPLNWGICGLAKITLNK